MARSIRGPQSGGTGPMRMLERTGLRKGIEGHRGWFYVGTGLWTLRTVRRLAGDKEEILVSERLKPGQSIVISNAVSTTDGSPLVRPSRRRRRKAAKQAQKQATRRGRKAAKRAGPADDA